MKIFYKRSVWLLLSVYAAILLVISIVGGIILGQNRTMVNQALGLKGYGTRVLDKAEDEDVEYFKSDFVKKDENGNILYTIDENGYKMQVYDDVSLHNATLKTAEKVQREGTTVLWNSETNGLPLTKGNKVSLLSHSSVSWGYSGGGSGKADVSGASDMKAALTNAGLSVNTTLWDFYSSGAGAAYTRGGDGKMINEVPWSVYTNAVKSSFSSYGDAAIIVFTRISREGSTGTAGDNDAKVMTSADTPTKDYYDLSTEEEALLTEAINLKNSGVFKKIIAVLNVPSGMFMDTFVSLKNSIDCCLWVGQTGFRGLDEVGNILVGASDPSGHLADTFVYNTRSAPSTVNIGATYYSNYKNYSFDSKSKQAVYITYAEGIYVGYKYYETRYEDAVLGRGNAIGTAGVVNSSGNWRYSEEVAFPFGYGWSFAKFEYGDYNVAKNADGDYDVTLTVRNVGSKAGKDAVQIYIQKPYTEYDRNNGIEQAAVNLCGYYKTKELAPNESERVTITVRDDAFKTYDANNKKTYIREKGDYYITAAQDAHEAINNVLAAKGKTPANTSGVMDAEGKTSLVKRFDFATDDFETYAKSEYTGNAISNQFDNADWNKYENKTDGTVTYLSRSDWQATYPTEILKIALSDAMYRDILIDQGVENDPEASKPSYKQNNGLMLIDLKGKDYDDPDWDKLLDELTYEEQIKFVSNAHFGTPLIVRIGKPSDVAADGPLGLKQTYTSGQGKTISYPSPTLLAASYNDELAEEVGSMMGEEALHSGVGGVYAPGSNIHRSVYGARNWEYHSEDGFLAGSMCKMRVIGTQSKGVYVHVKHFALNDQESYRHGVAIWANEQSIRELYLHGFEYAITEGKATGIMSAFVRFGTKWSGAHKGLFTGVVRGEWGFKGFVVSDSPLQMYMGVVDGIMAGNDCYLTNEIDVSRYDSVKDDPTFLNALRRSVHRILYVTANSAVMNGVGTGTEVFEVKEWWENLILIVKIVLSVLTGVLVLITVLSFVFHKKIKIAIEEKEYAVFSGSYSGSDDYYAHNDARLNRFEKFLRIGAPWNARRIITTVVCVLLSLATAVGLFFVGRAVSPEIGNNTDPTVSPSQTSPTQPVGKYVFEAENAVIETNIAKLRTDFEGKTASAANNPSGSGFIAMLNRDGTAKFTFNFTSSEKATALLGVCFGRREYALDLCAMFRISVNGRKYSDAEANVNISVMDAGGVKYYDWQEYGVIFIDVNEGENEIVFEKAATKIAKSLNFDYIYLYTAASISFSPTTNEVFPALAQNDSSANSGTGTSSGTETSVGSDSVSSTTDPVDSGNGGNGSGATPISEYVFNVNNATDPADENNELNPFSALNGGSFTQNDDQGGYKSEKLDGVPMYKYAGSNNDDFSCSITVEKACSVTFYLLTDARPKRTFAYSQVSGSNPYIASLQLNGQTEGITPSVKTYLSQGWNVFMKCEVATLELKAGVNVISFTIGGDNTNIAGVAFDSPETIGLGNKIA